MPFLVLQPPNWKAIQGGSEQEARWLADRDRKFALMAEKAERMLETSSVLEERHALFACSVDTLRAVPGAAEWYLALAAFSDNTLHYIRQSPESYGLKILPTTLRDNLLAGRPVSEANLRAFAAWIGDQLNGLYPAERQNLGFARAIVAGVLGMRALGQGQNMGGDDAVVLLKSELVAVMAGRGHAVEVELDGAFVPYRPEHKLPTVERIRFGGRVICEFRSGGNRPDIRILDGDLVVAVGEIKGRKDLSNTWESWMPTVSTHMTTWSGQYRDAVRLFFGTLITWDMIEGKSAAGTHRDGLKNMHQNGQLTTAYNIAKVASNDVFARAAFNDFIAALERRMLVNAGMADG